MLFKNNIIFFSLFFALCSFSGTLLPQHVVEARTEQHSIRLNENLETPKARLAQNASPADIRALEDDYLERCLSEKDRLECSYSNLYKELLFKGRTPEVEDYYNFMRTPLFKKNYKFIKNTITQAGFNNCSDLKILKYAILYRYTINTRCSLKETTQLDTGMREEARQNLEDLFELWEQYLDSNIDKSEHQQYADFLIGSLQTKLSCLSEAEQVQFYLYSDAHHGALNSGFTTKK